MSVNQEQRDFWSDRAGQIWVDERQAMDAALSAVLAGTLERAQLEQGHSVLDIGCGAGSSTLAVGEAVGKAGHVTGIDISVPLLASAQERTIGQSNIGYLEADAQTHPFVPQSADRIVSRFGVMFFADTVAAFRNISHALRPGGLLSFSAWGEIAQNPFFTLPAQVARELLGPVPKSDPDDPGPFALRDPLQLESTLRAAGLDPQIEVAEETLTLPGTARDAARTMCLIGPAQLALRHHEANEQQRADMMEALVAALEPHVRGDFIELPALINYATARKST